MGVYRVIYCITCLLNGMKYVGQTTQLLERRINQHKHGNQYIDLEIQKYGWENFTVEVLEECANREQLNEREKFWIAHLNCMEPNGYNRTSGGCGGTISTKLSERRSVASKKMWASKSKEERSSIVKKSWIVRKAKEEGLSSEEKEELIKKRSEIAKKANQKKSKEEKSASARKSVATRKANESAMSPSERAAITKKRSETSKKQIANKTPEERIEMIKPAVEASKKRTHEEKSEAVKKGRAKMTPETRSSVAYKAWETKRTKSTRKSPFKNLSDEISKRQFSYAYIAEHMGLSVQSVSHKMFCETKFTTKDIEKLVEIFGLTAEYLLKRDDDLPIVLTNRNKTSYKNLLAEIVKNKLSYTALAELMGLSRTSFSRKMYGVRNFTENDIVKLVEIFGKPADYLMKRDE